MGLFSTPSTFKLAGTIGVIIGLIGVIVPSLVYRGTKGQKYSFLNHYISELGEVGVSRFAWVFNLGMILSGVCIVIACLNLGLIMKGFWAKAGLVTGVATGIALSMVGVFPMNQMKNHSTAAIAFFRGGLLMVLFFSLAVGLQSGENLIVPRELGLVGLIPVIAFGVFLGLMWSVRDETHEALGTAELDRPSMWKFAISEWSIFFSLILWILAVAIVI